MLQGRFHTALGLQYYKGSPNSVSALTIQAGSGSTFFIHKWQNEGRGKQQHAELKMFRKKALEHFDNFTYVTKLLRTLLSTACCVIVGGFSLLGGFLKDWQFY